MPQILRTPDECFQNLSGYPFEPHYVEVNGVRMHYVDEGGGAELMLCLHGQPSWSYLYRHMIPLFVNAGYRVVAPDLIGFGRSDKFAQQSDYSFAMHAGMLNGLVESLNLSNITVIVQDWGGLLGLNMVREIPERFSRLVILNTGLPSGEQPMPEAFLQWQAFVRKSDDLPIGRVLQTATVSKLSDDVIAGYEAPFPDASYKAGAQIFPSLVPTSTDQPGAAEMKATQRFLATWQKPALVMFSDNDPIMAGIDKWFRKVIPTAKDQPEITISDAGHFLQEDKGEEIAQHVIDFVARTS